MRLRIIAIFATITINPMLARIVHAFKILKARALEPTIHYITHTHRGENKEIEWVLCWTPASGGFYRNEARPACDVLRNIEDGKIKYYTAFLEDSKEEPFDFWIRTKSGAVVRRVQGEELAPYLKTGPDQTRYNNLGELEKFDPDRPNDIGPTWPPKTRK